MNNDGEAAPETSSKEDAGARTSRSHFEWREALQRRQELSRRLSAVVVREPPWIVRDVAIVFLIGVILLAGQWLVDDNRSDRELAAARLLNDQASARDNLQFVRERSSPDKSLNRPFAWINLSSQNLSGLQLSGSDLTRANLTRTWLDSTKLDHATLHGATLKDAWLSGTNLREADLSCGDQLQTAPCTTLSGALIESVDMQKANLENVEISDASILGGNYRYSSFRGAHILRVQIGAAYPFSRADLRGADFTDAWFEDVKIDEDDVCWDVTTRWPVGFAPVYPPVCD